MIKHLACIMDGNRRWARRLGMASCDGHREGGMQAIPRVVEFCLKKGVQYLSLYAWAIQNSKRSQLEMEYLFGPLAREMHSRLDSFIENGIRIRIIGNKESLPAHARALCADVEIQTAHGTRLDMMIFISYGGREEMIHAIQTLAHKVKAGALSPHEITAATIESHLMTAGIPDPELVIRTGGHQRLSNFLLYQTAFSELFFLKCMWPEISDSDLENAFAYYETCQRNFGV